MIKLFQGIVSIFGTISSYFTRRSMINDGRKLEQGEQAKQGLKDAKKSNDTIKDVADLTDDELDSELWGGTKK